METFADKAIAFNHQLRFAGSLPKGFRVLNPFDDNPETRMVMQQFYKLYYDDTRQRKFIIGINPSRHGAGVTGVPFTDTKRMESECGIAMQSAYTHELSSVFMYDMIAQYGGVQKFYQDFYINSPFPLAIIRKTANAHWLNANYYDSASLFQHTKAFMIASLRQLVQIGLDTREVIVLGKKNALFIQSLNEEAALFEKISVLEHPRFIQQYRSKEKQSYIDKYITTLQSLL